MPDLPELPVTHTIRFEPDYAVYYLSVADIPPGAWTQPEPYRPATHPLELYRCLVCYGLVDAVSREGHYGYHVRIGEVVRCPCGYCAPPTT